MAFPYQLDPSAIKLIISTLFDPVVIVGAVPPGNLTLVNVAVLVPP